MDITSRHAVESSFAETYSKPGKIHPLRKFEQYDLVMAHRKEKPDTGSVLLSRRLDLPKGRIESWLQDFNPHGYDVFATADSMGWFDLAWDGEQFRALNEMIAWVLSSGTILEGFKARLRFDTPQMRADAERLCEQIGAKPGLSASGPGDEPAEIEVGNPTSATARILIALGAPRGNKGTQRFGLPPYLAVAPDDIRRTFAARYLVNRGFESSTDTDHARLVSEQRPGAYLEALRGLFALLTDTDLPEGVENGITIPGAAVEDICGPVESVAIDANSQN